jgi:hypothetical protein
MTQSGLHHDFADAEPGMSADWSNQSELRIVESLWLRQTSDRANQENKVCSWIQGISSISDEYRTTI